MMVYWEEFYYTFWNELESIFINSLRESKCLKALSKSQRQVIIRLVEKLNKDKQFISNWRSISLLNIDQKLISKTFVARMKKVLPFWIDPGQAAYISSRFLDESGMHSWHNWNLGFRRIRRIPCSNWFWKSFWFLKP